VPFAPPRRPAVAVLLAALALSGCGGSKRAASAAATSTPSPVVVDIQAPANGAAVQAEKRVGSRLVARVPVAGRAAATGSALGASGAALVARTSCRRRACDQQLEADASGAFVEMVTVWSDAGGRNGSIEVGATGSGPADRDRVVVLLKPPRRALPVRGFKPQPAEVQGGEKAQPKRSQAKRSQPRPAVTEPGAEEPAAPPAPDSSAAPRAPVGGAAAGKASETLVMIGDSLAEGTEPFLGRALPGWSVSTDARRGRPLAEGMHILGKTSLGPAPVLAFSLFTNDAPTNLGALEAAVRLSVQRAGRNGCAIWATISRPFNGGSYAQANARLIALAADPDLRGHLFVVPWAELIRRNPALVGRDRVHATPSGYRERARLYAQAAESCTR
jgi:hypothetical protein